MLVSITQETPLYWKFIPVQVVKNENEDHYV